MGKTKFYVVWQGNQPGIYDSWAKCQSQIVGYPGAKYKSFPTKEQAEYAYRNSRDFDKQTKGSFINQKLAKKIKAKKMVNFNELLDLNANEKPIRTKSTKSTLLTSVKTYINNAASKKPNTNNGLSLFDADNKPILESICVDGAWNTYTLNAEYRAVNTSTNEELFREGPFPNGTNNVVEFLAIVHALSYCKKNNLTCPIYSDSIIAIGWVRYKVAKTNLIRTASNDKLFRMIDKALKLLKENSYPNKILKWQTKQWGENPADFGRK